MRTLLLLLLPLLLQTLLPLTLAMTVDVGLLLPVEGPACESGAQYWRAAETARDHLVEQGWWPADLTLNITVVHAPDPYTGWRNAQSYTEAAPSAVALVGPVSSDGTIHVSYVGSNNALPVVAFSASASELTLSETSNPSGSLFRVCQSDLTAAAALWQVMHKFSWRRFNIMYARNEFGRTFFEALEEYNEKQDGSLKLSLELTFSSLNEEDVLDNLRALRDGSSRIVVLACGADDARFVLHHAYRQGMTGKGWMWLGEGWVHEETWRLASTSADQGRIMEAMDGALGALPDDGLLGSFLNGDLATYKYAPGDTAGDPTLCPELVTGGASSLFGLPAAPYTTYAFDAMWSVGSAVAAVFTNCQGEETCVTGAAVTQQLSEGVPNDSPLTGPVQFLASGDRDTVHLDLVNMNAGSLQRIAFWRNSEATTDDVATALQTGEWGSFATVHWPGNQNETPSDRVRATSATEAWFFFLVVVGVTLTLTLANIAHRSNVHSIAESGVAVLLGVMFGLLIRIVGNDSLTRIAEFDPQLFALVFLPIIIFESGYQMQKHAFFSQLGTILTLALLGTLMATIVTGGVLFVLGKGGIFGTLSLAECMTFGALISATDPVATLSVFSSLGVSPELYAIVYGEAVLNDAVGIVLFRTFAKFITEEASSSAYGDGVLNFAWVLFGSVGIGVLLGMGFTLMFRFVNLAHSKATGVTETALLLLTAYGSFTLAEACGLSGIVASLLCGITTNHYTIKAMSAPGTVTSAKLFKMLALIAEMTVFFQVGMNVVLFIGVFDFAFVFASCVLILLSRCHVFILSGVLNLCRRNKIGGNTAVQVWHAGLRGAIAYALSLEFPSQNQARIINTTSIITVVTIFVLGGTTTRLMRRLNIPHNLPDQSHDDAVRTTKEEQHQSRFKALAATVDRRIRTLLYRPNQLRTNLEDGVQLTSDDGSIASVDTKEVEVEVAGEGLSGEPGAPKAFATAI